LRRVAQQQALAGDREFLVREARAVLAEISSSELWLFSDSSMARRTWLKIVRADWKY